MTSRPRPPRRAPLAGGAAALAAAALLFLPWLVTVALATDVHGWLIALIFVALAALVPHIRLQPGHASRAALWLVLTQGALLVGLVGVFFETAPDTCGTGLAAHLVEWIGAAVIYLSAGAWALQRPLRGMLTLPVAAVVAGGWIAVTAHLIPGGAGACFN